MQTRYGRGKTGGKRQEKKKRANDRALVQLVVCLVLFLTVFIGKGVWPAQVARTGQQLLAVIRANTDFRAAFASLGQALSQQEDLLGEIGHFCLQVFAPERDSGGQTLSTAPTQALWRTAAEPVTDPDRLTAFYLKLDELPEGLRVRLPEDAQEPETEPALQVGQVVQVVDYQGEELPEQYSAQGLWLGLDETVTPVMGTVTSPFGYRDHPTLDRYAVHGGVDIGAGQGTDVLAFADGVVEFIGENDDYGLYLQLSHANGVTSFYSHCSALCVDKGDQVSAGDKVGEVGSTGQSTGPHLHFEISLNGTRLDPLHYIQPEEGS